MLRLRSSGTQFNYYYYIAYYQSPLVVMQLRTISTNLYRLRLLFSRISVTTKKISCRRETARHPIYPEDVRIYEIGQGHVTSIFSVHC